MPFAETALGIGALAGGAGQLAGGVSGLFGGEPSFDFNRWATMNQYAWKKRLPAIVEAAKKAGIHPLAALGMPTTMAPAVRTFKGRDVGRSLANMGQGMQRMLTGKNEVDKAHARLLTLQGDKIIESMRGQPDSVGITEENLPPPESGAYTPGFKQMEAIYTYENMLGERVIDMLPSRDAQDYLSESWLDNWKYRIQRERKGYSIPFTRIDKRNAVKVRSFLDRLSNSHPPRPGHYYAFNFLHGRPVEVKVGKYSGAQLFDDKRINAKRFSGFEHWRNKPGARW